MRLSAAPNLLVRPIQSRSVILDADIIDIEFASETSHKGFANGSEPSLGEGCHVASPAAVRDIAGDTAGLHVQ